MEHIPSVWWFTSFCHHFVCFKCMAVNQLVVSYDLNCWSWWKQRSNLKMHINHHTKCCLLYESSSKPILIKPRLKVVSYSTIIASFVHYWSTVLSSLDPTCGTWHVEPLHALSPWSTGRFWTFRTTHRRWRIPQRSIRRPRNLRFQRYAWKTQAVHQKRRNARATNQGARL